MPKKPSETVSVNFGVFGSAKACERMSGAAAAIDPLSKRTTMAGKLAKSALEQATFGAGWLRSITRNSAASMSESGPGRRDYIHLDINSNKDREQTLVRHSGLQTGCLSQHKSYSKKR